MNEVIHLGLKKQLQFRRPGHSLALAVVGPDHRWFLVRTSARVSMFRGVPGAPLTLSALLTSSLNSVNAGATPQPESSPQARSTFDSRDGQADFQEIRFPRFSRTGR